MSGRLGFERIVGRSASVLTLERSANQINKAVKSSRPRHCDSQIANCRSQRKGREGEKGTCDVLSREAVIPSGVHGTLLWPQLSHTQALSCGRVRGNKVREVR